jgi:hypothetical protein
VSGGLGAEMALAVALVVHGLQFAKTLALASLATRW